MYNPANDPNLLDYASAVRARRWATVFQLAFAIIFFIGFANDSWWTWFVFGGVLACGLVHKRFTAQMKFYDDLIERATK